MRSSLTSKMAEKKKEKTNITNDLSAWEIKRAREKPRCKERSHCYGDRNKFVAVSIFGFVLILKTLFFFPSFKSNHESSFETITIEKRFNKINVKGDLDVLCAHTFCTMSGNFYIFLSPPSVSSLSLPIMLMVIVKKSFKLSAFFCRII